MAELFGRNREEYNNMVSDPYLNAIKKAPRPPRPRPKYPFNASGYSNCCGFAATGTEEETPEPVNTSVKKMQTWQYAKTALALVGAFVVIKFLYGKFVK